MQKKQKKIYMRNGKLTKTGEKFKDEMAGTIAIVNANIVNGANQFKEVYRRNPVEVILPVQLKSIFLDKETLKYNRVEEEGKDITFDEIRLSYWNNEKHNNILTMSDVTVDDFWFL